MGCADESSELRPSRLSAKSSYESIGTYGAFDSMIRIQFKVRCKEFEGNEKGDLEKAEPEYSSVEWQDWNNPWLLLLYSVNSTGYHFVALFLVLNTLAQQKKFLVPCPDLLAKDAIVCEITKASVRSWPLLAVVVSIISSGRLMLHQRLYYELLKRGTLVNFRHISPHRETTYIIMVFSALVAVFHFVWGELYERLHSLSMLSASVKEVIYFYVVPVAIFLVSFWTQMDVENILLPLSKYFTGDPKAFKRDTNALTLIPERYLRAASKDGFSCLLDENTRTEDHVFEELVQNSIDKSETFGGPQSMLFPSGRKETFSELGATVPQLVHPPNEFTSLWPARVLLDVRVTGKANLHFRCAWLVFTYFALFMFGSVAIAFLYFMTHDVAEVLYQKEYFNVFAIAVEGMHAGFAGYLVMRFCSMTYLVYCGGK
eukprot:TRINITY_DN4477_c1_g1_i3.p1 TRINITY_DN4477_c1_g1~~TRINITY_DN4477_c1_g1_i3.p1  ORF type:complete len:429 (-),score=84.65 TRINITY_DN4477_c1_g1_i3:123-1409(-)